MGWFQPKRDEVWRQLSQELHGEFIEASFWKGRECKVRAHVGPWAVTLETGFSNEEEEQVTRLLAPFHNPEGLRFTIYRAAFLSELGKRPGSVQHIQMGDPLFDQGCIVQGNDEPRVRTLLAAPEIRKMVLDQPRVRLVVLPTGGWFRPKFPAGVDELQLQVAGKVRDMDRLRDMFKLFAAVLARLCEIGVTRRESPEATA